MELSHQVKQVASSLEALKTSKQSAESGSGKSGKLLTALNVVNHALIAVVTGFVLHYASMEYNTTNVHAALCTVGYVLLMSEAIVVLAGENVLTNFLSRRARSHLHWVLQVLAAICVLVGFFVMFSVKSRHFLSVHAITGVTSIVLMCVIVILGYPVISAAKMRKLVPPVYVKTAHNFLGISCFVVGMVSQCYAYQKNWLSYVTGNMTHVEVSCTILTVLIAVLCLRGPISSMFRQIAGLFKS